MKTFLSNYMELVFTALGLLVILAVPALFLHHSPVYPWKIAAVTATAVGVIHGLLFYGVRRREREARSRLLHEVRGLADVLCNQLQVVMLARHAQAQVEDERHLLKAAHTIRRHVAALR
jgi:predicted membrane channel-forming protein YqfA (hemolysin III family)